MKLMKTFRKFGRLSPLLFAALLFAIHLCAQSRDKNTERKPVPLPPELVDHVRKDLESPDCVQESGQGFEQQIRIEELDLTKSTTPVLLITGLGPCLTSSTGNSPFLLYSRFGNNWRKTLSAEGQTFRSLSNMYNGWHDVDVDYHTSGTQHDRYVYRFTKNEYKAVSCEVITDPTNSDKPVSEPCPGWKPAK